MKQIWKSVEGWEGFYEVSTKGKVRSLKRKILHKGKSRTIQGKVLRPRIHKRYNYRSASVLLCKDNKGKETMISRLVAIAFIPNPENKKEVNHKDNNALNNRVQNLEWVSHYENMMYSYSQGRLNNKRLTIHTPAIDLRVHGSILST